LKAQTILIIYLCFFFGEYIFHQFLTIINLQYGRKRKSEIPQPLNQHFDTATFEKSVRYTSEKERFTIVEQTLSAAFLLVIILSGSFGRLEYLLLQLSLPGRIHGILYIFCISLIFSLFSLPFSAYSRFVIENKYGFNKMKARLFFFDFVKGLILTAVIAFPLLYGLFFIIDAGGQYWWLFAFGLVALFQLLMTVLYPIVIAPLFNKYTPLEEGPRKDRLNALAETLSFRTKGIFVMNGSKRSRHSNAFFIGLGKVKRIVFYDTLLEQLEDRELEAILAHEIGHEKKKHTLKMYIFSMVFLLGGLFILSRLLTFDPLFEAFGFTESSKQALFIIISLCAGPLTFLFKPLLSVWSRKFEYQADAFAVRSLHSADGLCSGLTSLSKHNLSNLNPHPLFSFYHYSHPTLVERIKAAESITLTIVE